MEPDSLNFYDFRYSFKIDLDQVFDQKMLLKNTGFSIFENIKNIDQTHKLTSNIRKIFKDQKYPILIDQEGGRINRLKNIITFDNLTSEFFGKKFLKNEYEFRVFYKLFVDKTAFLLKQLGININSVPVLDLRIKGSSNVIGDRSYSKNPKIVSKIGDLCIKLFHENSVGTIIKHIPGHGLAKVDSHRFTPKINRSLKYLMKNDFKTFKKKNSFFAMTGHLIFEKIVHFHR